MGGMKPSNVVLCAAALSVALVPARADTASYYSIDAGAFACLWCWFGVSSRCCEARSGVVGGRLSALVWAVWGWLMPVSTAPSSQVRWGGTSPVAASRTCG